MDVNQIREKKVVIEEEIRDLIVKFLEETGLIVEGISLEMTDVFVCGKPRQVQCTAVTLDVRLG